MIKEIQAKTLLSSSTHPDSLFGIRYTMNLYRGCQHQCIYCDSRSECYRIEDFRDILVKANAIDLLRHELPSKRTRGTIGTGSMNDPYMPLEARYNLTGRALEVVAEYGFPIHIITKGTLVLRDMAVLRQIARVYAAVSFTITTADDQVARKVEPGAPSSSARFAAMRSIAVAGIYTGVTLMPVLPYIEDTKANIEAIVRRASDAGARYILPWFGLSMRDRQRAWFYEQLDRHFPGLKDRYQRRYGGRYECQDPDAQALQDHFLTLCDQLGMASHMEVYTPVRIRPVRSAKAGQLTMFQ